MLRSISALVLVLLWAGSAVADNTGLGRPATPEEIAAWNIDIRPDGQGLPEGQGTAAQGEVIFLEKCASCHGDFAEGIDNWPALVGGEESLRSERPVRTISSYWPYLSTVFDYTYRTMPFGDGQSLTPDQTYAVVAYMLYMGDVIDDDAFVLSNRNFTSVKLANEDAFFDDPRPDVPGISEGHPCMENCKDSVSITARAGLLDVTPNEDDEKPRQPVQ